VVAVAVQGLFGAVVDAGDARKGQLKARKVGHTLRAQWAFINVSHASLVLVLPFSKKSNKNKK
jgi:hypothetical protein